MTAPTGRAGTALRRRAGTRATTPHRARTRPRLGNWARIGALVLAGCVPAQTGTGAPGPDATSTARDERLPPPGRGTLRQAQFTVELRSGPLRVKVTPLAEEVIRLAAPDTYQRLHRLADTKGQEARTRAGSESELFLVSFFSYQPDVAYRPEILELMHRGRQMHARAVVPLSGGWGRQRLRQQETQNAVYAFPGRIDYGLPIVVRYGLDRSDEWQSIIPVLDRERSRVGRWSGSRPAIERAGPLGSGAGVGGRAGIRAGCRTP